MVSYLAALACFSNLHSYHISIFRISDESERFLHAERSPELLLDTKVLGGDLSKKHGSFMEELGKKKNMRKECQETISRQNEMIADGISFFQHPVMMNADLCFKDSSAWYDTLKKKSLFDSPELCGIDLLGWYHRYVKICEVISGVITTTWYILYNIPSKCCRYKNKVMTCLATASKLPATTMTEITPDAS